MSAWRPKGVRSIGGVQPLEQRVEVDGLAEQQVGAELFGVEPGDAVMVGDSVEDDIDGARALGMRAFLLDRRDRFPEVEERLPDLRALPAALGLTPA